MIHDTFRRMTHVACMMFIVLACVVSAYAQGTTGNVRGIVTDPSGAVVPGARITITNRGTNETFNTQTTGEGEYQFIGLVPGTYVLSVEAANFRNLTINDVRVELNQTTDIPAQLTVGLQGEVVEVSAGGAELVETTTTTLSRSFSERQVVDLAQTSTGAGVYNLALIAPNVSNAGGVGVGTGGSVGGQRPRNNNFVVDGIDNNDKSVTGPQVYVSPEVVSEFSLLQNHFSAEFARSNGGQFITVTKSGTNEYHGSLFGFFRNRYLNALDVRQKEAGVIRERDVADRDPNDALSFMPRLDYFRGGWTVGGPLPLPRFGEGGPAYFSGKDRLFFFTAYERLQQGAAASAGGLIAPTARGISQLTALSGLFSPTNFGVFTRFVPVAPTGNEAPIPVCTVRLVGGLCPDPNPATLANENETNIETGLVTFPLPNFFKQNNVVINIDFNQSQNTTHRWRFNMTNFVGIDTGAFLPAFLVTVPSKQRLFSYTNIHTFSSNLTNELRLGYRRSETNFPVPDIQFPGLDQFPNIGLNDLGFEIGPNGNFPQFGIENNYQIVDNMSYLFGNHSLRFGGDWRNIIAPQSFVQRQRGDYQYSRTDLFLQDFSPDLLGQRTVGSSPYYGNQQLFFAFVQDDWRVRPNLTLNLGVNYSYQGVPRGAKLQELNAIASVPGVLEFRAPKAQTKNFAPKVGLAYAPNFSDGLLGRIFGAGDKSSIRAGFSLGYDYIFDNLYLLALPPQANQTRDIDVGNPQPGFLTSGGISPIPLAVSNNPAAARAATSAYIPDQEVPYSISWTLSFQRQFLQNYSLELRYLGTRGIHLLTQNRINAQNRISDTRFLPTFFTRPSQAQLDALTLTLPQLQAGNPIVPRYDAAGFNQNFITGFLSNGNSTYHGGSAQLQRRFTNGFQFSGAYTWSHLIDDTTAEVFSTVLSPRRVEDFQNVRKERADSALDRRHRFVFASIYELPFFRNSENFLARSFLGGWSFAGTYTYETGQPATALSGVDANLNFDAASDRTIRNPNGVRGTGSAVTALRNSAGAIVGYLANNPNAEYIQAGAGARSNSARNTLRLPPINNLDFSLFKNFAITETRRFQLRADLFNAFNHPQFIAGSPNSVSPIGTTGVADFNTVSGNRPNTTFNRADRVFSSNPRVIQFSARFDF